MFFYGVWLFYLRRNIYPSECIYNDLDKETLSGSFHGTVDVQRLELFENIITFHDFQSKLTMGWEV